MKLKNTYAVVEKQTGNTVGYPVYAREQARELKRDIEQSYPEVKLSIVKMIVSGVVR